MSYYVVLDYTIPVYYSMSYPMTFFVILRYTTLFTTLFTPAYSRPRSILLRQEVCNPYVTAYPMQSLYEILSNDILSHTSGKYVQSLFTTLCHTMLC